MNIPDNTLQQPPYEANSLYALHDIAQVLATRSGEREILHEILQILSNRCFMIRGTIMLLSAGNRELVIEAVQNSSQTVYNDIRYQWGEGVTGKVVQTGEPAIIPRVSEEPLFKDRIYQRRATANDDISFICVPIKTSSDVIGTLAVDLPISNDPQYLINNERLLSIVSSMIAHDANSRRSAHLERELLQSENMRLRDALGEQFRIENIVGNSKAMHDIFLRIHQVAQSDTSVLIRGESGTGKELAASAVHYMSSRKNGPFIKVNCAALSEHLIESELFGHEKGAFTGAIATRKGRFEEACHGTLFLDEIGDFPTWVQVRLLRVLQERCFERVGSNKPIVTDVRLIAATNRNLEKAVELGTFRQDLYYRINVFPIVMPPLRDRKDDVLLLVNYFCKKYASRMAKPLQRLTTRAIDTIMAHDWPGNVRELENCIEHAIVMCKDGVIHSYDLPPTLQIAGTGEYTKLGTLKMRVALLESELISDALRHTNGNINAAARELGSSSRILRYKLQELGLNAAHFKTTAE
jgi:Nif-specific regulatory protein